MGNEKALEHICLVLTKSDSVEELYLCNQGIDKVGLLKIIKMLEKNVSIKRLHLSLPYLKFFFIGLNSFSELFFQKTNFDWKTLLLYLILQYPYLF